MPVFDYRCKDCGNTFEVIILSSATNTSCPSCGSINTEKTISSSYVVTRFSHKRENFTQDHSPCCGRSERCDKPPCSDGGVCRRNK